MIEINDNEIRIISPKAQKNDSIPDNHNNNNPKFVWLIMIVCVVAIAGALYVFLKSDDQANREIPIDKVAMDADKNASAKTKSYVDVTDTTTNNVSLTLFTPRFATAQLRIGAETLQDTTAILVLQAADVREDNGQILGAYVLEGNLVSKGQSKSGFCAIINGKPIVGVSEATSYLEQAIETNGYFFRQYPLVVGGQVVENKPKGKAVRRALAERNDEILVVISRERLTFYDFAQALVDIGVSDAIYLVGSSNPGFAIDSKGHRIEFCNDNVSLPKNANYIVWK